MGQRADAKVKPMAGMKGWKPYDYAKRRPESIPSGTLVIIAYIIIWVVVLAYVVILARRFETWLGDSGARFAPPPLRKLWLGFGVMAVLGAFLSSPPGAYYPS